jgi:hypothetical protein
MEIREQLLADMLDQQHQDNILFQEIEVVREIDESDTIIINIEEINKCSRTGIFEEGELVILKRFIGTKLYRVEFKAECITVSGIAKWLELEDDLFKRCATNR